MLISQSHFDGPLSSSWAHAGPAEANGLPESHGPSNVHGPRGHCIPLPPPLGGPARGKCLQCFNTALLEFSGYFLELNNFCKILQIIF